MIINLFEEFPTEESLSRLALIDFPVNVFLAAPNLASFYEYQERVLQYDVARVIGYWPVLEAAEGYWLSPFSKLHGIKRVISEIKSLRGQIPVLWDAELPYWSAHLLLTELDHFISARRLIRDCIYNSDNVFVAEHRDRGMLVRRIAEMLGISFDRSSGYLRVEMLYGNWKKDALNDMLISCKNSAGNYYPAFGAIAEGFHGRPRESSWKRIDPKKLDEQLRIAQDLNIKEVFIYRLGGLNEDYIEVIGKYARLV